MTGPHRPSQGELRAGERMLSPDPHRLVGNRHGRLAEAKIRRWVSYRNPAGTMLGFLSAELPSKQIIHELKLMRGSKGKHWVALPAIKQLDQDGKPRLNAATGKPLWSPIIEFADRATYDAFQAMIIEALRRAHPEALDGGAP
jgi:hypothetical protein